MGTVGECWGCTFPWQPFVWINCGWGAKEGQHRLRRVNELWINERTARTNDWNAEGAVWYQHHHSKAGLQRLVKLPDTSTTMDFNKAIQRPIGVQTHLNDSRTDQWKDAGCFYGSVLLDFAGEDLAGFIGRHGDAFTVFASSLRRYKTAGPNMLLTETCSWCGKLLLVTCTIQGTFYVPCIFMSHFLFSVRKL